MPCGSATILSLCPRAKLGSRQTKAHNQGGRGQPPSGSHAYGVLHVSWEAVRALRYQWDNLLTGHLKGMGLVSHHQRGGAERVRGPMSTGLQGGCRQETSQEETEAKGPEAAAWGMEGVTGAAEDGSGGSGGDSILSRHGALRGVPLEQGVGTGQVGATFKFTPGQSHTGVGQRAFR